jgi:hypothetical protein
LLAVWLGKTRCAGVYLPVGAAAAVAAFTCTAAARAGDPDPRGLGGVVRALALGAADTADPVAVAHRGGPRFSHPSRGSSFGRFNRMRVGSFNRFGRRTAFRRFDRIEDRLEGRLRRTNPFLFRRFDRAEDRLEGRLRFGGRATFRRFDRIEDRLEGQLQRANPRLFRRFDRIEDRLEGRLRTRAAGPSPFAFRAFGDPERTAGPRATGPAASRVAGPPVKPGTFAYRAYGE